MEFNYRHSVQHIPEKSFGSTHNSMKTIGELSIFLQQRELLNRFNAKSSISYFLKLNGKQLLVTPLMLNILARELVNYPNSQPDEMWFEIGGRPYRFGKQEFLLVTGLQFGYLDLQVLKRKQENENSLLWRLFKGVSPMLSQIMQMLRVRGDTISDEDVLKLSNIVIAYNLFYGYDNRARVDDYLWVLIEDINLWNKFPFGTVGYSRLIESLRHALDADRLMTGRNINLYGFIWAFQARYLVYSLDK